MCLIFIGYRCSPANRYIVAANRDEFRNRPSAPLDYLDPEKTIIGGRDLRAGGMWLGARIGGAFGAVTNYRDGTTAYPGQPSRGEIVYNYLSSNLSAYEAMEKLAEKADEYAGVNVIFGDGESLVFFSNREMKIRILEPGFYGLSNHLLDTPWPKVVRGKELLDPYFCGGKREEESEIFAALNDDLLPPDKLLPDTGVGIELERLLGPIFIRGKDYGTVSSAVLKIQENGDVIFSETSYIGDLGLTEKQGFKQMSLSNVQSS